MKKLYLLLAILGAIVPYMFFFQFIQINGFDLPGFVAGLFVNGAAGGFSADLFIILNLTIGLSCAFPAYLYARET